MDSNVDCYVNQELVGQSHPEGSGKQLIVPVGGTNKWCPSRVHIGILTFINDIGKGIESTLTKFADLRAPN